MVLLPFFIIIIYFLLLPPPVPTKATPDRPAILRWTDIAIALRTYPSGGCFAMHPQRTGVAENIFYERYGTNEDALVLFIHGGVGGLYTYVTGKEEVWEGWIKKRGGNVHT